MTKKLPDNIEDLIEQYFLFELMEKIADTTRDWNRPMEEDELTELFNEYMDNFVDDLAQEIWPDLERINHVKNNITQ